MEKSNVNDSNQADTSPKEEMKSLKESYSKVFNVDTAFSIGGISYKFKLKHYCTMDSAIKIPAGYNFDSHQPYVTHNFVTDVIFLKGYDTVRKMQVTKNTFRTFLWSPLDSFGSLLPPNVNIIGDTVGLDYSISIPATDVGIGVTINFDNKGNYYIKQ